MIMKITYINIKSFRNLKNVEFSVDGNTTFSGKNHLGKTNVLNACYWCLTGTDLYNSSKNELNVPNDLKNSEIEQGTLLVDVELTLETGKVRRTLNFNKGTYQETIYIDGYPTETLKDGEIAIDKKLGIIGLTIANYGKFELRRFLLNPLYALQVTESELRQFYIGQFDNESSRSLALSTLKPVIKDLIQSLYDNNNGSVSGMSKSNADEIKSTKKDLVDTKLIRTYLNTLEFDGVEQEKQNVDSDIVSVSSKLQKLTSIKSAIDMYAASLGLIIEEEFQKVMPELQLKLFEHNYTDTVIKECCKPIIRRTGLPLQMGSTSEKILKTLGMVFFFEKQAGVNLPVFIDEGETLDLATFKSLSVIPNQFFISIVKDTDEIVKEEF